MTSNFTEMLAVLVETLGLIFIFKKASHVIFYLDLCCIMGGRERYECYWLLLYPRSDYRFLWNTGKTTGAFNFFFERQSL